MKTPRFIILSSVILSLPAPLISAEDRTLQNAAYQASVEQEQLRSQTQRLVTEITAMLEEFRKNPAATEEVALTETTLQKLQSLSDADMSALVLALREASKTAKAGDTSPKIVAASKTAKEIQVSLARLADKLALYQDEASVELRLTALIRRQLANQRQARYLVGGILQSGEQPKEAELTVVEQKAIGDESDTLLQSLQRLAATPASSGKAAFAAAYQAGVSTLLIPNSQMACSRASAGDFPNTLASQGKVVESLQGMLLALDADKTLEERYRAAEQKMRSLATREQALARTTTKSSLPQQRAIIRRQQEIADQRTILEREIAQLTPNTAPLLGQTRQTLETLDLTLQKDPKLMDRPEQTLGVVTTQNDLAKNFLEIAEILKKQGDAVANASSSGQGNGDQARQALADAASSVMDAIDHMDMAKKLLDQGGDTATAKDQMAKGQGNLDSAMKQLGGAKDTSPQGVGEKLENSRKSLGKGEEQARQGGGNETKASLGEAKDQAAKALADLQKTLSAMSGQNQVVAGSQDPSKPPSEGGWGSIFHHNNESTPFSALAKISEKDRAALATLQREKSPPEYDTMSQQYLKNLADGVVPAQ